MSGMYILEVARGCLVSYTKHFCRDSRALASDWLMENDRACWEKIADGTVLRLVTDKHTLCLNEDVLQKFVEQVVDAARKLWFPRLTREHFDTIMALFGDGIIDEFHAPYGEVFDCFEFDTLWNEYHKGNDKEAVL